MAPVGKDGIGKDTHERRRFSPGRACAVEAVVFSRILPSMVAGDEGPSSGHGHSDTLTTLVALREKVLAAGIARSGHGRSVHCRRILKSKTDAGGLP